LQPEPDQRFPRNKRLTAAADYRFVFAEPQRLSTPSYTVLVRANERQTNRIGIVVSRKVAAHAVQRNRIKRLVRESFRHQQQKGLDGFDIVVIARHGIAKKNNNSLFSELEAQWSRLARWKKSSSS